MSWTFRCYGAGSAGLRPVQPRHHRHPVLTTMETGLPTSWTSRSCGRTLGAPVHNRSVGPRTRQYLDAALLGWSRYATPVPSSTTGDGDATSRPGTLRIPPGPVTSVN